MVAGLAVACFLAAAACFLVILEHAVVESVHIGHVVVVADAAIVGPRFELAAAVVSVIVGGVVGLVY